MNSALTWLTLACAALTRAAPAPSALDDTVSVGSYVREVRAAAPEDYHRTYENEGDGEIGYSRKKSGGGKKGYQHFDSYHKKAGDAYEFEKQDSYGDHDEGQQGAHSERHEQTAKKHRDASEEDDENPRAGELRDEPEGEGEGEAREGRSEEGASDGNGGVEASGHDPADYVLPEKYTYGTGDEYDF
ncbi:hypothetical protein EVAR_94547_1 [Eumeta japonica]|uniref:Uncharacterized protein n=1 Tax=Eumeta variegata TaxID=151549 RepID=A0A4C1UUW9_EUMVA|nr:hypothetical protein EVAR_94547_1 [Eumeta japonica]